MVMNALRQKASGGIGKFILFGFLVLAAGGLVFSDVGGFFRGGVGSSDIARVGDETIPITVFDRTLRRTISRIGMTPEQAYAMGYVREILNSEVRGRLIGKAAADHDIKISKNHVAKEIQAMLMPMVGEDQDPKDVLNQLLLQQGLTERELVRNMQRDLSIDLLRTGIAGGFSEVSDAFLSDMAKFEKETRSIEYITFPDKDFKDITQPEEQQLLDLYSATKEAYSIPETRTAQLITLKTDKLAETLDISEDDVRAEYEDNIESYSKPETRSIEQAILYDAAEANSVFEMLEGGKSLKDAVKEVTKNTTDYLPAKSFKREELLEDIQDTVFSASKGDKIGPVETALGQHIVVVKDIKAPHTESFDSVKKALRKELVELQLSDTKYELANTVDDLLAGGAAPEDLKEEVDIEIKTLPAVTRFGQLASGKPALNEYEDERTQFLETIFELGEGESSAVFETEGGQMMALFVQTITPKAYKPFEEIKDTLAKRWNNDQRRANNKRSVMAHFETLQEGEKDFKALAQETGKAIKKLGQLSRDGEAKEPLTPTAQSAIFEAPVGESVLLDINGGTAIAHVTANNIPKTAYSKEEQKTAKENLLQSAGNEGLALFIEQQNKKYTAAINDRLLEQVYSQQ